MPYKTRPATLSDMASIAASRRKLRVLRLNLPYTLVQPYALPDLFSSQLPLKRQNSFLYVCVEGGAVLSFVEARCRWRRRDEWTITTLGGIGKNSEATWEELLRELSRAAGEAGVIRVFAKVAQSEPVAELFRGMGFTHYTTERVWGNAYFPPSGASVEEPERGPLRKQTGRDSWDLMQLYRAVSPPVVQRAEALTTRQWHTGYMPRPSFLSRGLIEHPYVWPDQTEGEHSGSTALGGFVRLLTGSRGHWVTVLFRSDAANRSLCGQALDYVLWKAARLGTKPVYCAVREYQAELESLLEERNFHMLTEQSLLVKYMAEPVREAQPVLTPFLAPVKRDLVVTDFHSRTQ